MLKNIISDLVVHALGFISKQIVDIYKKKRQKNIEIFKRLNKEFTKDVYNHLEAVDFTDIWFKYSVLKKLMAFVSLCENDENCFTISKLELSKNNLACKTNNFCNLLGEYSVIERDFILYPKNDYFDGIRFEDYISTLQRERDMLLIEYEKFIDDYRKIIK